MKIAALNRNTQISTFKKKKEPWIWKDIKDNKYLVALSLPALIFFVVFAYLPMFGLIIAFEDFDYTKGIFGSRFVGLANFGFLKTPDVLIATFNTIYLNLLFIITSMCMSILIAILLSELKNKIFTKITQSVVILPHFLSWTIVAMFSTVFLASDIGVVNKILVFLGMKQISFYTDPSVWPATLVILNLWHGAGFGSIVYLAAITGIDQEIYEAATIDGATRFQCITRITLPMLKTTAILLFIMAIGKIFYGNFGMIYALVGSNGLLYPTTDVIDTYVYRSLMELGNVGMASAVGLFQSVVGFILVIGSNWVARKTSPESAIF